MQRFAIAFLCGVLMAALVAACGGDDEKAPKTTLTVPTETETTPTTETVPTATTPAPAPPPQTTTPPADTNSGGAAAPRTTPRSAPQDGPGNDTPPEPGSPAERFERQCEQNPQTCGD